MLPEAGNDSPLRRLIADPPKREDFHNQEEFEEALGYWQENVGRIKGMADSARAAKGSPDQDRRADAKAPAQGDVAAQTQQQARAGIETLIEAVDILMKHLSAAYEAKSHEAISIMLLQVMHFGAPDSEFMQLLFPVMDRLQRLIVSSNLGEALEQADLLKTQPQEVNRLLS